MFFKTNNSIAIVSNIHSLLSWKANQSVGRSHYNLQKTMYSPQTSPYKALEYSHCCPLVCTTLDLSCDIQNSSDTIPHKPATTCHPTLLPYLKTITCHGIEYIQQYLRLFLIHSTPVLRSIHVTDSRKERIAGEPTHSATNCSHLNQTQYGIIREVPYNYGSYILVYFTYTHPSL